MKWKTRDTHAPVQYTVSGFPLTPLSSFDCQSVNLSKLSKIELEL